MFKRLKLSGFLLFSLLFLLAVALSTIVTGMTIYKNYYIYNNLAQATNDESENSDRYLFDTFYNVLLYKNSIFSDKNLLDLEYSADQEAFLEGLRLNYLPNDDLYFDVGLRSDEKYLSLNKITAISAINAYPSADLTSSNLQILEKVQLNDEFVIILGMQGSTYDFFFFLKEEALIPLISPSYENSINVITFNNKVLISTDNTLFSLDSVSDVSETTRFSINKERYITVFVPLSRASHFSPLTLISFINYEAVYGTIDLIFLLMVLLLIGVFVVVGIISYRNVDRVVKPIRDLSKEMSHFKQDEAAVISPDEVNEVFELETSFDEMVERIETLIAKQHEDSETKRKLELESLQTQINPHFLYNALDSIAWMSKISHNKNIEEFIILLAKFYRLSLHKGAKYVKISEEMDIVKFYLSIQAKIFPNLFTYETDIDEGIQDAITLKLILQPLVENAIKYAFHSYDVKGKITVNAREEDDNILFTISDNGRGFDVLELANSEKENRGFGLRNVKERLKLEYEGKALFKIASEINVGTTITITIPKTF